MDTINSAKPPLLSHDEQPLRIKAVAQWLGVSDKTVRRLMDRLEIVSFKMGGLRVATRAAVRAYLVKINPTGGQNV